MISLPVILEGVASRADKSWKLTFGTQEITPEAVARIASMQQNVCYLAINPNPFSNKELEIIKNTKAELADTGKSHSQRLRGVLYVKWENENEGYDNFHDYYIVKMDKIINHYKNQLP